MSNNKMKVIEKLLFQTVKHIEEHCEKINLDVSSSDIISDDEICIYIDCPTKRDDVGDEVYFHYLKIFEIECRKFIDYLIEIFPRELVLIENFYDISEHGEHGEELYYSCGLICRIEEE